MLAPLLFVNVSLARLDGALPPAIPPVCIIHPE